MNEKYIDFLKQLMETPFRRMLFSVYNVLEDDGYLFSLKNNKIDYDIDDLEFCPFVISDDAKVMIKRGRYGLGKEFKSYIESELQHDKPQLGIILMKEHGAMVAVKPKSFDLTKIISPNS